MRAFAETQARRTRIAADFRAKLVAELADKNPSASRGALTEKAISAYTQATELSEKFLQGRATPAQVAQLSIARGQLQRALRSLGAIDRDDDDAPEDVAQELKRDPPLPETLEQYIARTEGNGGHTPVDG